MWKKIGLIIDVAMLSKFSVSHAAIPLLHKTDGKRYRLFFASRDARSRSHIYSIAMDFSKELPSIEPETVQEVMGPGSLGAFDDSGVMPGWIVEENDRSYLYYTGWSLGQTVPFYFYIGLATSSDGYRFERVSEAPVMGRTAIDPYLTASACVIKEHGLWRMWYVSGKCWQQEQSGIRHYYFIRSAHSSDGIHWIAHPEPCIDFASRNEYAMARPCVVAVDGGYLMWYSFRGESYRLGLAVSRDGRHWRRVDDKVGIDVSASGWDSQMVAYAHVVREGENWWMVYNGNEYGKTGIGLAKASELPTVEELMKE